MDLLKFSPMDERSTHRWNTWIGEVAAFGQIEAQSEHMSMFTIHSSGNQTGSWVGTTGGKTLFVCARSFIYMSSTNKLASSSPSTLAQRSTEASLGKEPNPMDNPQALLKTIQALEAQLHDLENRLGFGRSPSRVDWPFYPEDWDADGRPINHIRAFVLCLRRYRERQKRCIILNRYLSKLLGWTGWF